MGLVITANWEKDSHGSADLSNSGGVTLAQMADAVERATRECELQGIDTRTVEPKTLNRIGGKIRRLIIEV